MNGKDRGELLDISEDVDEISDDVDEIAEDTDEILRRLDNSMKALVAAQRSITILIVLWLLDKIIMWGIFKFG